MDPVPGVTPTKGGYYLWQYLPNAGAAVVFLILFLATALYNSWRMYRTRAWYCTAFIIGCFMEFLGYGVRLASRADTGRIMPFAVQNMFILLAPILFAATVYMTLGRIITSLGAEDYSYIRPRILTRTFVTSDIVSLLIQGGGSGLMVTGNPSTAVWGERLIIIGLVVQTVMFGLFGSIAGLFHYRYSRMPAVDAHALFATSLPWKRCLLILYLVSALVMVRSIFRLVEYAMGNEGYPLRHEWTMYVFDALLMWIVTVVFDIRDYRAAKRVGDSELH